MIDLGNRTLVESYHRRRAQAILGKAKAELGLPRAAIRLLKEAIDTKEEPLWRYFSGLPQMRLSLASAYIIAGDDQAAETQLKLAEAGLEHSLKALPLSLELHFLKAQLHFLRRNYRETLKITQSVLRRLQSLGFDAYAPAYLLKLLISQAALRLEGARVINTAEPIYRHFERRYGPRHFYTDLSALFDLEVVLKKNTPKQANHIAFTVDNVLEISSLRGSLYQAQLRLVKARHLQPSAAIKQLRQALFIARQQVRPGSIVLLDYLNALEKLGPKARREQEIKQIKAAHPMVKFYDM